MFDKEIIDWLIKEITKRRDRVAVVVNNPNKYKPKNLSALRNYVIMANKALEWLKSLNGDGKATYVYKVDEIEFVPAKEIVEKLKNLEFKVEQLEIIVKRLMAYHEGEIDTKM